MSKTIRPTIIAGNWKMNKTRAEAGELAKEIRQGVSQLHGELPTIVLMPAFTSLEVVLAAVSDSPIAVGAQNMDYRDCGPFTGEVSPAMLVELGIHYVIIGHSERRQLFGETNQTVNLKVKAALSHGLIPIVCVGETLDERENNLANAVISRQVAAALAGIEPSHLDNLILAYEPVWAIGTGQVCKADEANQVIKVIRHTLANLTGSNTFSETMPVLYGGSVDAKNITEQLAASEVDGVLVGGASLVCHQFLSIIDAARHRAKLSTA